MVCMLCEHEIQDGEPRFYFPKLPSSHHLSDIKGVLHTSCLVSADALRDIGGSMAEIAEGLARRSESAPFVSREGNVVLRNRISDGRIEVLDFEDFCEISIPLAAMGKLKVAEPGTLIVLGMQVLHVEDDGQLVIEHKSPAFDVRLPALNLSRLQSLLADASKPV